MLLTEPVATAASWFCRGGAIPGICRRSASGFTEALCYHRNQIDNMIGYLILQLKKKKRIRLAFVKMDLQDSRLDVPNGPATAEGWVGCIPFTSGVCRHVQADNVLLAGGLQMLAAVHFGI